MMLLSKETLAGIRITVHSFLKFVPYLFTIPGVRSFLSERISQDPLEKFIRRQRQRGGVNDNPNVAQFLKNNQALRVINSIDLDIVLGNTRGSNQSSLPGKENADPLRKRHRHEGDAEGSKDKNSLEISIPCDPDSPFGMFVECMKAATRDKGFQLPSPEAQTGHSTACALLKWAATNTSTLQHSTEALLKAIITCFKEPPTTKVRREKIWVALYHYLTSAEYRNVWSSLIELVHTEPSPTLYFYITHHLFCQLLKRQYPISTDGNMLPHECPQALTKDEEGALRYVGGYMIRSMRKKIERRSYPLKEEMILALYSFRENTEEDMNMEVDEVSATENWAKLADRGGLYHVRTEFYNFLYSVELVVKKMMSKGNIKAMKDGFALTVANEVQHDDDALFWWWTLCSIVDTDKNTTEALLPLITEHYIVVRGFAFAARWMEAYKCENHRNVQKSKGLRKKLLTS